MTQYWARIASNSVAEIINVDPVNKFHPSIQWLPIPEVLNVFIINNAAQVPLAVVDDAITISDLTAFKQSLRNRLKAKRYEEEIKGRSINGMVIPTDDRSKILLHGARTKAEDEIRETIAAAIAAGKTEEEGRAEGLAITHTLDVNDTPVRGTNAQFIALARAIGNHTQDCFDRWGDIWELIEASDTWEEALATFQAEINTGWPVVDPALTPASEEPSVDDEGDAEEPEATEE